MLKAYQVTHMSEKQKGGGNKTYTDRIITSGPMNSQLQLWEVHENKSSKDHLKKHYNYGYTYSLWD